MNDEWTGSPRTAESDQVESAKRQQHDDHDSGDARTRADGQRPVTQLDGDRRFCQHVAASPFVDRFGIASESSHVVVGGR